MADEAERGGSVMRKNGGDAGSWPASPPFLKFLKAA